ncbi:MAG: ATP/GTP-binding protein [Sphaerochaetaceae bacterium]
MLVRFNVGNFLSFNKIQEFSMLKGKPINKSERVYETNNLKLLKFAALFGANASGKSNLAKSIAFAQSLIIGTLESQPPLEKYAFKLEKNCLTKPSFFEFEILIDNELYSYGFEVILSKKVFISEWLIKLLPSGRNIEIFKRESIEKNERSTTHSLSIKDKSLKNKFEVYLDDIKDNKTSLFLTEINKNKDHLYKENSDLIIFRKIFEWFYFKLEVSYPNRPLSPSPNFWIGKEKTKIISLFKNFGIDIEDYFEEEVNLEHELSSVSREITKDVTAAINSIQNEAQKSKSTHAIIFTILDSYYLVEADKERNVKASTLKFSHRKEMPLFSFSEESDGTKKIIDLLEVLLTNNKVFIIDEIDRSLHPQLTYRFAKLFLEYAVEKNIQLIITTHESRLLDFDLLRQDEIWLIDKNKEGSSTLYSLDEYNVRFDRKIDKAYLEGRYGGVPIFNKLYPLEGNNIE